MFRFSKTLNSLEGFITRILEKEEKEEKEEENDNALDKKINKKHKQKNN